MSTPPATTCGERLTGIVSLNEAAAVELPLMTITSSADLFGLVGRRDDGLRTSSAIERRRTEAADGGERPR